MLRRILSGKKQLVPRLTELTGRAPVGALIPESTILCAGTKGRWRKGELTGSHPGTDFPGTRFGAVDIDFLFRLEDQEFAPLLEGLQDPPDTLHVACRKQILERGGRGGRQEDKRT
jgi:hypothetical protein